MTGRVPSASEWASRIKASRFSRWLAHDRHGCARQTTVAQVIECAVCFGKRVASDLDVQLNLGRDLHERFAVCVSQIRNRHDAPFAPQNGIGKRRDIAHVDTPADDYTTLRHGFQRDGHKRAHWREDRCGVDLSWCDILAAPCPCRSQPARELLRSHIAGACKCKDRPALRSRNLRHNMRRRAKTANADTLRVTRHHKRPIADQSRAQQRGRMRVIVTLGQMQAKAAVCNDLLGVSAVDGVSGEAGEVTKTSWPLTQYGH